MDDNIRMRTKPSDRRSAKSLKKGLLTLHTLELMAINIYRYQLPAANSELNARLIAAMSNEMKHLQDFQVKLFEYGWKPRRLRWAYWIVGFIFGYISRIMGEEAVLRTGIWVETKAVRHYDELLESVPWDEETKEIVQSNQADEYRHIEIWKSFFESKAES